MERHNTYLLNIDGVAILVTIIGQLSGVCELAKEIVSQIHYEHKTS